jgi:hypothetical protein
VDGDYNAIVVTLRTNLLPPGRFRLGLLASSRCAVGVAALTRPVDAARLGGIDRGSAERLAHLARLLGARDIALGAGLLVTLARDGDTASWVWAGVLSDTLDALIIGSATARGRLTPLGGAFLTAAAVSGVVAATPAGSARRLRRRAALE